MILFFSATGNTRYVATSLAKKLDDQVVDLTERMQHGNTSPLHSQKPFVLCTPVHVDGVPLPILRHVASTPLTGNRNGYAVVTMGSFAGIAGRQAQKLFLSKNMTFKGCAEIAMPRNYLVGVFPAEKTESIEEKIRSAPERVDQVADVIAREASCEERHIPTIEYGLVLAFVHMWNRVGLSTKKFEANQACIGCGMCERVCPVSAIRMESGVPVWSKSHCMHCMACIQNCPKRAIEYGNALQKKPRYRFAKYSYVLKDGSSSVSRGRGR